MRNPALCIIVLLLFTACKKQDTSTTTTPSDVLTNNCNIHLWGIRNIINNNDTTLPFMQVNESTGIGSTAFTLDSIYFDAFEHPAELVDSTYYIIAPNHYSSTSGIFSYALHCINIYNGKITRIPFAGNMRNLCYYDKKKIFYAISYNNTLISFNISAGTLVNITTIGSINIPLNSTPSLTVNSTNGDLYIVSSAGMLFTYNGTSISSIPLNRYRICGVKYDQSDGYLYGIYSFENSNSIIADSVIKIDPMNGGITSLIKLPYHFNVDYYSTVLDQCSGVYIISTRGTLPGSSITSNYTLYNCTTNKSLSVSNPFPPFQGLAIKY